MKMLETATTAEVIIHEDTIKDVLLVLRKDVVKNG